MEPSSTLLRCKASTTQTTRDWHLLLKGKSVIIFLIYGSNLIFSDCEEVTTDDIATEDEYHICNQY